jgi:L-alanine-DL-glutamate epimerase-like enolase superfamily enzyme
MEDPHVKIASVETLLLSIPFVDGGRGEGMTPSAWNRLETVLVKIVTTDGLVGWGESFGYFCGAAVKAMLDQTVAPMLVGMDGADPAAVSDILQRRLALFGRYGITIFALSGVDLALWDLKGKREGKPLSKLIGQEPRRTVPAYASLVRYGDVGTVADVTARALGEGYRHIKLHEITKPDIAACDDIRGDAELMVDVNCSWSVEHSRDMMAWLADRGAMWLEEPIFPPEDFATLASLADGSSLALSAGENLCTAWQFAALIASGAVRYPQPSVTKVGGVSEVLKILPLTREAGLTLMPHSPYFGPGYLASLHLCAILPDPVLFEYLYVGPDAWLFADMPLPVNGSIAVPTAPGLGMDPDPDVIRRYRVA